MIKKQPPTPPTKDKKTNESYTPSYTPPVNKLPPPPPKRKEQA
jgi:hypothetical protein